MKLIPIVVLAVLAGFALVYVPGVLQHQTLEPGLRLASTSYENATTQPSLNCQNNTEGSATNSDANQYASCNSTFAVTNGSNGNYPLSSYTPSSLFLEPSLVLTAGVMLALLAYVLVRKVSFSI